MRYVNRRLIILNFANSEQSIFVMLKLESPSLYKNDLTIKSKCLFSHVLVIKNDEIYRFLRIN